MHFLLEGERTLSGSGAVRETAKGQLGLPFDPFVFSHRILNQSDSSVWDKRKQAEKKRCFTFTLNIFYKFTSTPPPEFLEIEEPDEPGGTIHFL